MIGLTQYNPTLTRFYKDLDAWVKDGTPSNDEIYFLKGSGICNNLLKWCAAHNYEGDEALDLKAILYEELHSGMGTHLFPFDTPKQYVIDPNKFTNTMRVSYIHFRATID